MKQKKFFRLLILFILTGLPLMLASMENVVQNNAPVLAWTSPITGESVFVYHDTRSSMPRSLFFNAYTKKAIDPKGEPFPGSINVFGFQKGDQIILIDAGFGAFRAKLPRTGISEADVTDILLTHVHPDHVDGLLQENELAAFPKAIIYLSELESQA